jgi:hypothetical protein
METSVAADVPSFEPWKIDLDECQEAGITTTHTCLHPVLNHTERAMHLEPLVATTLIIIDNESCHTRNLLGGFVKLQQPILPVSSESASSPSSQVRSIMRSYNVRGQSLFLGDFGAFTLAKCVL